MQGQTEERILDRQWKYPFIYLFALNIVRNKRQQLV